jgi:dephospho-CoA kinase
MLIVGLTGSMGMGKSTVAAMFRARGINVFDADAEVHRLYEGEAVEEIEKEFPGTISRGRVDRERLAKTIAGNADALQRLEDLVHPLVRRAEQAFLRSEAERRAEIAALEIPLLFETGADVKVDAVVVVSASADAQRARLEQRPGMTAAKLEGLLVRQVADAEKRRRADFVVDTDGTIAESERQVDAIIAALLGRVGTAYERHWT